MLDNVLLYTSLSLLMLCLVLLLVLWVKLEHTNIKLMQSIDLIDKLYSLSQKQEQGLQDVHKALTAQQSASTRSQASIESKVEQSLQGFDNKLSALSATVDRLEEQDPALKMYSKASKLVEQGADMQDVIEASGLPRAEVEVLMALHARKA